MSRWKIAGVAVVLLLGAFGIWYATTTPPQQLSTIDAIVGGGAGVEEVAEGAGFGDHGQKLDVWRPEDAGDEPLPVIVFYYGGGWHAGTRGGYAFAARGLANQGFVVVVPDYRKYPQVRFPKFVEDGADALRWVKDNVARYGGDTDRVAIAGHSAGAHIAAMLALDTQYLRERGIAPGFVKAAVGLSGPYDFLPLDPGNAQHSLGNWPRPKETQPITYARAAAPPMLLVTSSEDSQVNPRNAVALTEALRAKGAPVAFIDYPGLSHENVAMALSKPFRGLAPVRDAMVRFIRKALAGEYARQPSGGAGVDSADTTG